MSASVSADAEPAGPVPTDAPAAPPEGGIRDRIDSGYGALSPQEQRAADFILDHLDDLAVVTATAPPGPAPTPRTRRGPRRRRRA